VGSGTAGEGESRRPGEWATWAILGLVYSTVLVTAWSGVPYITKAMRAFRKTQS